MASLSFPLRFDTEEQKKAITKIAKENSRSLNAQILYLIGQKILSEKQWAERRALQDKTK